MKKRLAREIIADAAAFAECHGNAALAAELRAIWLPGRPSDPAHRENLLRQRQWMKTRISEGHSRDEVLQSVARRYGGKISYWQNVLTGNGRSDLAEI